jgi:flagellar biosynthesis/type III secretory pathway protein FliH
VLRTIERSHLSPHEAFLLKEEAQWDSAKREARGEGKEEGLREGKEEGLREGKEEGLREGKEEGLREGEARGLRAAVLDLCELLGIEPTDERRAQLEAMGVGELEALRAAIKGARGWPL